MAEEITKLGIHEVLPSRFLGYSQSILQDRAIPSAFDGLKPVHRRILMSYHSEKLYPSSPYKKCAKVVGVCLGLYHPHGDQSVYDALVGLAQPFNMRYPLVDGSGNFGSVNGDPAAAMRYTESRLSQYGELMLQGVDKLCENKLNFDGSSEEPVDLASFFPSLLMNGSEGIAAGLATKFAPHYAKDVYTAIIKKIESEIDNKRVAIDDLIDIIKAPDFPTGAQIINGQEIRSIYKTGKGSITLRSVYHMEKDSIVYTEIPYKKKPSDITQAITSLNISDIKDVRDESSLKEGLRIVVELKKNANSEWIINKLFKDTPLQSNFNVNMTAIMNNRPEINLDIEKIIVYYIDNLSKVHLKDLNLQISESEKKLFTIDTMLKAIDILEQIVQIIKNSDAPILDMQNNLGLNEKEAEFIYNSKLSSLSKASKEDLDQKKKSLEEALKCLKDILASKPKFLKDLANKIKSVRDSKLFKDDKRRTEILNLQTNDSLDMRDFIKEESVVISYSNKGMVKATRPEEYKANKRNAQGVKTKSLREDEFVIKTLTLTTHDSILLFSNLGKCFLLPVYKIPITGRNGASKSINNFLNLAEGEFILTVASITDKDKDLSVILTTKFGYIKRIAIEEIIKSRTSSVGTRVISLREDDKIKGVNICKPNSEIVIFTSLGRGLKINIDDETKPIKMMGKAAKGVLSMKLRSGEELVNASVLDTNHSIVLVTTLGFGKRLESKAFKDQKRLQSPINYMSKIDKVGKIVDGIIVTSNEDILITTKMGQTLRTNISNIQPSSKTAMGVKYINIKEPNDVVASIASIPRDEELEDMEE
jgi:DNA gyrase subunit A